MKKFISLALVLIMVFCIVGCRSENSADSQSVSSSAAENSSNANYLSDEELAKIVAKKLNVPEKQSITYKIGEKFLYEAAETYCKNVAFYENNEMVASATVNAQNGELVRNIYKYDENRPWYQKVDILYNLPDQWTTFAVETDDCVYYKTKTGINKWIKADNTDKQIVSNEDIGGLSKYGNLVYYNTINEIKCIDIADDNVSDIWDWSKVPEEVRKEYIPEICGFWFYQDDLYVMDSYISAVRVDLKTGHFGDFLRDFSSITFIGDNCYYTEHAGRTFSIYEMNINTKSTRLLLGNGKYDQFHTDSTKRYYDTVRAVGDKLYYTMRDDCEGTYLYNPDGNDTFLIPADYFSLNPYYTSDSFFYYVGTDKQYELYEYNLREKTNRLLATNTEFFIDLIITESYVLFRPYENADLVCLEY